MLEAVQATRVVLAFAKRHAEQWGDQDKWNSRDEFDRALKTTERFCDDYFELWVMVTDQGDDDA
jgi:hypothetical protein